MIEYMEFQNKNGDNIVLNTDTLPVDKFGSTVDVRVVEEERPVDHGLWPSPTFLGKRVFSFEGNVFGQTSAEYIVNRRNLANAFYPQLNLNRDYVGTLLIRFAGMAEILTSKCTLEGWPEIPVEAVGPAISRYMIQLKSFDPRMYGQVVNHAQVSPGYTTPIGRTYNKTYNRTYPNITTPAVDTTVTNSGDIDTSPIVTFYGPGSNPEIRLIYPDTTYASLSLPGLTLQAGDTVVVDFARKTVLLNGSVDSYRYKSGIFWTIPSGTYTIRTFFGALPLPTTATKTDVAWQNAYML
jgi:hypothetical protein